MQVDSIVSKFPAFFRELQSREIRDCLGYRQFSGFEKSPLVETEKISDHPKGSSSVSANTVQNTLKEFPAYNTATIEAALQNFTKKFANSAEISKKDWDSLLTAHKKHKVQHKFQPNRTQRKLAPIKKVKPYERVVFSKKDIYTKETAGESEFSYSKIVEAQQRDQREYEESRFRVDKVSPKKRGQQSNKLDEEEAITEREEDIGDGEDNVVEVIEGFLFFCEPSRPGSGEKEQTEFAFEYGNANAWAEEHSSDVDDESKKRVEKQKKRR